MKKNEQCQRKRKGQKKTVKEIMAEIFPYLMKNINLNIQEAQQTPKISTKRNSPKHTIVKML